MFCTNCGTRVVEGSAHCTSCGTRVEGVAAAAVMVGHVARSAYSAMDEDLKKSLMFGGGSLLAALVAIVLAAPAALLLILLLPSAIGMGIMALNAGRGLDNRAGYYFGMIGLCSAAIQLHLGIILYAVKSAVEAGINSAAGATVGLLGRSLF